MKLTSQLKHSYLKNKNVIRATNPYKTSVFYKLESIELNTKSKDKIYTIRCKNGRKTSRNQLTARELMGQTKIISQLKKPIILDLIVEALK